MTYKTWLETIAMPYILAQLGQDGGGIELHWYIDDDEIEPANYFHLTNTLEKYTASGDLFEPIQSAHQILTVERLHDPFFKGMNAIIKNAGTKHACDMVEAKFVKTKTGVNLSIAQISSKRTSNYDPENGFVI